MQLFFTNWPKLNWNAVPVVKNLTGTAFRVQSIPAERVVKDAVRILKGPANVMVTKELIQCARQAHHEYMVHLENEQKAEGGRQKAG